MKTSQKTQGSALHSSGHTDIQKNDTQPISPNNFSKKTGRKGHLSIKWLYAQFKKLMRIPYSPYIKLHISLLRRSIARKLSPYQLLPSITLGKGLYYAHGKSDTRFPEVTQVAVHDSASVKQAFTGPGGKSALRVRWKPGEPSRSAAAASAIKQAATSTTATDVSISAPLNGKEAFQWKKRLIGLAEKRIVLSGNYCGGQPYDEILQLMEQRLQEKPELRIVVLVSPHMLTSSNKQHMKHLKKTYPDRFQSVHCGEKWMNTSSDLYKKVMNHTKGLVVDGKHCVMGGSGIEERWSYADGVGEKTPYKISKSSMLNAVIADEFRDIDFLFSGEQAGKHLDEELLKLARLWENYNHESDNNTDNNNLDDTVVGHMLAETPEPCPTTLPKAHLPEMVTTKKFELYSQGPEMSHSAFYERLINEVREAKQHIYIDHQYVHPTPELLALLAKKVNDGVKLTVVTNGVESYSPNGHSMFASRNRYVRAQLFSKINPECRHLFNWYEYGHGEKNTPQKVTLHSKVVVVDDTVLSGSSNLGYKSTVTCSDHEVNFVSQSPAFAQKTIAAIEGDAFKVLREVHIDDQGTPLLDNNGQTVKVPLSRKSDTPEKLSYKERVLAMVHARAAWLIG